MEYTGNSRSLAETFGAMWKSEEICGDLGILAEFHGVFGDLRSSLELRRDWWNRVEVCGYLRKLGYTLHTDLTRQKRVRNAS